MGQRTGRQVRRENPVVVANISEVWRPLHGRSARVPSIAGRTRTPSFQRSRWSARYDAATGSFSDRVRLIRGIGSDKELHQLLRNAERADPAFAEKHKDEGRP